MSGFDPVTIDNLDTGHRDFVRWGRFIEGDIADAKLVEHVLRDLSIAAVVHFAANAYVGESVEDPGKYYRNNLVNSLGLLDALRIAGKPPLVFSSTCATYGVPSGLPIREDHPQVPINPYGETKLAIERALHWYGSAYEQRSVSLRYFNAAGADADAEIGERHEPETHLIPLVIEAALGQRDHVKLFGTDYDTRDGTAVRDYVHVEDLAAAHVAALRYLLDGGSTAALNIGTGNGYSVRQIIETVEAVGGRRVPVADAPRREGDPAELVADASRAGAILDWAPCTSDINNIVATAWRWHHEQSAQRWDANPLQAVGG